MNLSQMRRSLTDEEVKRPEVDLVRKDDVEILGVLTQPGPSSAHGRRVEVQQPGSPSVFMSASRVIKPSPTTGELSGKASIAETSCVELSVSYTHLTLPTIYSV